MPDFLTPEEKAAIAAFPQERVYRCARGESGIPITGHSRKEAQKLAASRIRRTAAFTRSREIDSEIQKHWKNGLTDKQISVKVNLKPSAVYMRRYRMGICV